MKACSEEFYMLFVSILIKKFMLIWLQKYRLSDNLEFHRNFVLDVVTIGI